MNKSNLQYWLALRLIPKLAIHKKLTLVEAIGLNELFVQSDAFLKNAGLNEAQRQAILTPDWHRVDAIIKQSQQCHSVMLAFDDPLYPKIPQQIYDPPLVLFVKGNTNILNCPQLAIVGSRSASASGREITYTIAQQLVQQGLVITSGLALGIDAAAHRGALTCQAATIAVVATGLDIVYPHRHRALEKEIIAAQGAIVSEFLPGVAAKTGHFPRRNRLISGLSLGVLVVEAALRSGSLITARCALEQNREVFAVPGSIYNPLSTGCHWLIKQGAKLIQECADITEELAIPACAEQLISSNKKVEINDPQDLFLDPLLASVGYEATPVDIVVSRSKLPTEVVLTRLTMLELRGLVSAVPGGYLRLSRG